MLPIVPSVYKYLIGAGVALAALGGAWLHGHHVASVGAERDYLERINEQLSFIQYMGGELTKRDAQLRIEQQRTAQVQTVEVIKYVTKYRDRVVRDPVIVECINDSGLLDILNATMPTVAADPAAGRPDGHAAADAPIRGSGDGRHGRD